MRVEGISEATPIISGWPLFSFGAGWASKVDELNGTVVDFPKVTPFTGTTLKEQDLGGRVSVSAADVVGGPLNGSSDVVVDRSVVQVLSADQARRTLKNIGEVIAERGDLFKKTTASGMDD